MHKKYKILISLFFAFCFFTSALRTQWYQQTIPVTKPVTGIEFIDSLKGWACTSRGTGNPDSCYILNTTNGGINWYIQYVLPSSSFFDIDMVTDSLGYSSVFDWVSGLSSVYKTTNAGINWVNVFPSVNLVADDVFFVNKDSGYVCGGPFTAIYTTTNGGSNWYLRTNGVSGDTRRIFFLNYNTGFVAASFSLYKTTNAGMSWGLNSAFGDEISSVLFLNQNIGWLGVYGDKLKFTSNGGANWVDQQNPQFSTVTDFYFASGTLGYAGTSSIYLYKTTNGGLLWGYQRDTTACRRITFIDSIKGWSGDAGISHTTNGGGPITYVGIISINTRIPGSYALYQNYPNPFNSQTNIRFSLTRASFVKLKLYDILGREKTIWESGGLLGAGTHRLSFEAKDYSSGVYFYQITILNEQSSVVYKETRKMILIK